MAAHVFCLMLNLVTADVVDPAPPPPPPPAAEPAPPATSIVTEMAPPQVSPTPAPDEGRERMRRVTETVLDLPYAATALGLWGVMTIATLLALTTEPARVGVNLPSTLPGNVQPWVAVRVTGVVLSLALGMATAALLLFPPSALKAQLL